MSARHSNTSTKSGWTAAPVQASPCILVEKPDSHLWPTDATLVKYRCRCDLPKTVPRRIAEPAALTSNIPYPYIVLKPLLRNNEKDAAFYAESSLHLSQLQSSCQAFRALDYQLKLTISQFSSSAAQGPLLPSFPTVHWVFNKRTDSNSG